MSPRLPQQRWQLRSPQREQVEHLLQTLQLSPLLAEILINRGVETPEAAQVFLKPETQVLTSPLEEFPDLTRSVALLREAILSTSPPKRIAICGDYDADGMTSTALLLRTIRWLGGQVNYAIPSRMRDGYGINRRIVEEFSGEGVDLILTVDNGIAAVEPIARARELGIAVIVTDHHELPPELPPADAILNPKLLPASSPYRSLAGVGVAYVLAVTLAQSLGKSQELVHSLLELFTLGTIADLAPLTAVNRRWVQRGLKCLPHSRIPGVQALIQIAGVGSSQNQTAKTLKPEDIGFRLGPRINAVGRIADPQIVIELLTTDDPGVALERAMQCEQINQQRQQLCAQIEQEAVAWCNQTRFDGQQEGILVIVQPHWHHGVIGIVASRLVERYGVPVFIGTYEDEAQTQIRGSARGIPEFNVFEALQYCDDLFEKYGGHRAAGGFSLRSQHLEALRSRLRQFARQQLQPEHLKPLVTIDALLNFAQIDLNLDQELDVLHPCGIDNPTPVFWTPNVEVIDQQIVGRGHLKLVLKQDNSNSGGEATVLRAIAWRWAEYFPLPQRVDVAYQLRTNTWNGSTTVELELVGVRPPQASESASMSVAAEITFDYKQRSYTCCMVQQGTARELRIWNAAGQMLTIEQGQRFGFLKRSIDNVQTVDVTQPHFYHLIKAAAQAIRHSSG